MPSKAICILLLVCVLVMGCFTESSITRNELAPDESKVIFYLQDGSYIKSFSGNHHRIDSGYQISGEIARKDQIPKKFEGVLSDAEIAKVTVEKFNVVGTVLGCVLGGMVIAGAVYATSSGFRF